MKNPAESGVSAGFFNVCAGRRLADLNGGFHADLDGLLVHRDEVVVTGREGLFQSGCHVLHLDDGLNLQECSEDDHVVGLGVAHLGGLVCGVDPVDLDVGTGRMVGDAVGVIDEQSAGLDARLELVEGLLVEDDGGVAVSNLLRIGELIFLSLRMTLTLQVPPRISGP